MKKLYLLLSLALVLSAVPSYAVRCSGGVHCHACSNCKDCKHCGAGGTCSVCRPESYRSTPSTSRMPAPRVDLNRRSVPAGSYSTLAQPRRVSRTQLSPRAGGHMPAVEAINKPRSQSTPVTAPRSRPTPVPSTTLQGKVIGVSDGDTVTLLVNRSSQVVRLYGIDCPEKGQPFSEAAKQLTSALTFGKTATVYSTGEDRAGRTVGWLFIGGTCVNRELITAGLAWWYQEFARHEIKLDDLEQKAREAKAGLWSEPDPIAPWEWRRAW